MAAAERAQQRAPRKQRTDWVRGPRSPERHLTATGRSCTLAAAELTPALLHVALPPPPPRDGAGAQASGMYPSLREMKVLKGGSNKNPDFSKVAVVGIDFHGLSFVVKGGGAITTKRVVVGAATKDVTKPMR